MQQDFAQQEILLLSILRRKACSVGSLATDCSQLLRSAASETCTLCSAAAVTLLDAEVHFLVWHVST